MTTSNDSNPEAAARDQADTLALQPEVVKLRHEVRVLREALAGERRRADEYGHRNRNLLGMVAALVRQCLAEVTDLATARTRLDALLVRLSLAHMAGREADSADVPGQPLSEHPRDLHALAEVALAAFMTGSVPRISLGGPPVTLGQSAARLLPLVLFELATNSVKHGVLGPTGGALSVRWEQTRDGGLLLNWHEERAASAIVTHPGKPRVGGGMALLRAIEDELNGRVVTGLNAHGFYAELTLPAGLAEPAQLQPQLHLVEADPEPVPAEPADTSAFPQRVLVVEDNPLIADDLADLIRAEGVGHVDLALSAEEAQAQIAAGRYDLVMLDVTLGDTQSDLLLPLLDGIKVVVVSGRASDNLPTAFRGLRLIPKPFLSQDIADALRP